MFLHLIFFMFLPSESSLNVITSTCSLVLRAGWVEVKADGEFQTAVVYSLIQIELMDVAEDGDLLAHGGKDIVNGQLHTQAVMEECLVKTRQTATTGSCVCSPNPRQSAMTDRHSARYPWAG